MRTINKFNLISIITPVRVLKIGTKTQDNWKEMIVKINGIKY